MSIEKRIIDQFQKYENAMAGDFIYLINMGDEVVWCDSPAPSPDMEAKDAVKYVRVDFLENLLKEKI